MDRLIADYIAAAEVVVPLPNPNFDPAKFDPSAIGVQKGGLKMPASTKASGKTGPAPTVNKESMLGWIAKGADVSVQSGSLRTSLFLCFFSKLSTFNTLHYDNSIFDDRKQ